MKVNNSEDNVIIDCSTLSHKQINNSIDHSIFIQGNTIDVLDKIDDNVISLGITSPPYNKQGKNKGWLVKNVAYDEYNDAIPEDEYQQNQIDVLDKVYRITEPGGSFFYNHKLRWSSGIMYHPMDWLRQTEWVIKQQIIWDRSIASNIRGWRFWQVEELIFWLYKPQQNNLIGDELKSKHAKFTSIWRGSPERYNSHPAPFPIWIPARIIISLLDDQDDGIILDPYSGSGTTAVAANILGYKYIGIEISSSYIQSSYDRILKNNYKDITKLEEERLLHVVKNTFKQRKNQGENTGKFSNANIEKSRKQLKLFDKNTY